MGTAPPKVDFWQFILEIISQIFNQSFGHMLIYAIVFYIMAAGLFLRLRNRKNWFWGSHRGWRERIILMLLPSKDLRQKINSSLGSKRLLIYFNSTLLFPANKDLCDLCLKGLELINKGQKLEHLCERLFIYMWLLAGAVIQLLVVFFACVMIYNNSVDPQQGLAPSNNLYAIVSLWPLVYLAILYFLDVRTHDWLGKITLLERNVERFDKDHFEIVELT